MVMISSEARSRISNYGKEVREIQQAGVPFNIPLFVPLANPFVEKQLLFFAQYKLAGVTLEEVREGVLFGDFSSFMDRKMETFSRKNKTRHFKINPFTIKLGEVLGGAVGQVGVATGHTIAAAMVAALGLVEWEMSEEETGDPDVALIHVDLTSRFFRGVFKFRIHRRPDGVIIDDDWLPSGGGDVRTATIPMANLVLSTHPLGFEQITERVVEEILQARAAGRPYVGQIKPPAVDLDASSSSRT